MKIMSECSASRICFKRAIEEAKRSEAYGKSGSVSIRRSGAPLTRRVTNG